MDAKFAVADISTALVQRQFPTVVLWNRIEGRPRTHDFDRALKAEVRDALWMLAKQWQMGEFNGDDAGSAVFAKAHISTTSLTKYKADGHNVQSFEENVPLETKVEQRKIAFERDGKFISTDLRLQMGRRWLKAAAAVPNLSLKYIGLYFFELPVKNRASADLYAHPDTWQQYAAISGRCMDGYKLYQHLKDGNKASDNLVPALTGTDKTTIDDAGDDFVTWFESIYYQPLDPENNAWLPSNLEYQFACSAPSAGDSEKVLTAEEYYSGHLDWYSFNADQSIKKLDDIEGQPQPDVQKKFTNTFIPANVQFEGMPNRRWWAFEDSKTSFGDIKPSTVDISKLLLMEFGLIYSNDWYLVPFTIPAGTISTIEGLAVTNNFGERFWIEPAGKNSGNNINDWKMFTLDNKVFTKTQQNTGLLLAPAAMKVQEGNPIEDVRMIRDEMANMVWGIEAIVPSITGEGKGGKEYGQEVLSYHKKLVEDKLRLLKEASLLLNDINGLTGPLPVPLTQAKTTLENIITAMAADDPDIDDGKKNIADAKEKMKAEELNVDHTIDIIVAEIPYKANISYLAMTSVPEHWIPFVPVHIKEDDNREIQLQRASMLRIIDGDSVRPVKIKPVTSLMREGLEQEPKLPYYIREEEVPRAGAQVIEAFQRTRWTNGEVFVWLGNQKKTGRGEASSGLAFDQIIDVKPATA